MIQRLVILMGLVVLAQRAEAQWRILPATDSRTSLPSAIPGDARPISPGDAWPEDHHFRWMAADLKIPSDVDGKPVAGLPLGLKFNCGDGGELWLDGQLQVRYDNDHPAMLLVTPSATPGQTVRVWVQVYGQVQGGNRFGEAAWARIDPSRCRDALPMTIDSPGSEPVPDGLIGLSQGGGMCDYDASTAAKLREGGFKWFRMDNIFTPAAKRDDAGKVVYDWTDFDRRRDFLAAIGAEPVFAASYMPQAFDAVPDNDRHSAPRDYAEWEELCARAARRCVERGKPVRYWEVWNEVNTGWLKPGPQDTGAEPFREMYAQAIGKEPADTQVVRRFEAYCRLYRATAQGVRRGDPDAKVGGPALASGPFDELPGVNGRGFARGLMLFCAKEKLPLDFLSWHEYFQTAEVMAREAQTFRTDAEAIPAVHDAPRLMFLTEWNEAWWPDRPHDHELGAAWCADGVIRSLLPAGVKPCLFYAKQSDGDFRGDWSILMKDNLPKPTYNMAKVFNSLRGVWAAVHGGDDQVCGIAAWDRPANRLQLVLVNFNDRNDLSRKVRLAASSLPSALAGGTWRRSTIDATHSNIFNDRSHAELEQTATGSIDNQDLEQTLAPNSINLFVFTGASR